MRLHKNENCPAEVSIASVVYCELHRHQGNFARVIVRPTSARQSFVGIGTSFLSDFRLLSAVPARKLSLKDACWEPLNHHREF